MDLPLTIVPRKLPHPSPKVTVYYPVIINMQDALVQRKMNYTIISTFNQLLVEQQFYSDTLVELVANFEIKTNERRVLSLNLIVYSFTGGAHGMTVVKSLTFDTTTGQNYPSLDMLFKRDSPYVERISSIVRDQIKRWDISLLDPPFTSIRKDQDFYLADHSLVVYFQLYEISPYVAGFPYFPIPLKDLEDMIPNNSLLERLIPFV